jgi:4-hydroxybenzoate polyprenyltransferase
MMRMNEIDSLSRAVPQPGEGAVLAVDLDDCLLQGDILHETLLDFVTHHPGKLARLIAPGLRGKAYLKAHLAEFASIEPAELRFDPQVVEFVRKWKADGGRAYLVTATDQTIATRIADHLGLFDGVFGSCDGRNLKGAVKAQFLVDRFGAGNFDYIGDSRADLAIWKVARRAITVGLSPAARQRVRPLGGDIVHLERERASVRGYVKALRPHQWLKNLLIFLPLFTAHSFAPEQWAVALVAFLAFSLIASSVYVLNDLLDLRADRAHPRKRNRPFASGAIPLIHGMAMAPLLLAAGFALALVVGRWDFFAVLGIYYVVTLSYSLVLKRKLIIDVCTLAALYTLRIVAGGEATGTVLSEWLLAFSMFLFLSLAAIKRQGELVDVRDRGELGAVGRGYHADDLPIVAMMAIGSGYVSVLVLALYLESAAVTALYRHPLYLLGLCPILLYWISRMVLTAHRGQMHDDPIVFAARDGISRLCGVLSVAIVIAGTV